MKTALKDFWHCLVPCYARFDGDATRSEFRSFAIISVVIALLVSGAFMYRQQILGEDGNLPVRLVATLIAYIPFYIPLFAVRSRYRRSASVKKS